MVTNMPIMNTRRSLCSVSEEGKSHRLPFPTQQIRRATKKLELVHTEICGPMHTDLMNGSKYFILFIDDFSRYTWIHFMKMKSEAFQMFIKFKALAENEADLKIKTLRSDNGAEFLSNQFQEFLQKNGIIHQLSTPYSPQQNGVCERKNYISVEHARCLLFKNKMPKFFWVEAVNTAIYLQNQLSTKALNNITPYEAWTSCKLKVKHLRIFGSVCYIHVPQEKRTKLDKQADVHILVSYSVVTKGYKLECFFTENYSQ